MTGPANLAQSEAYEREAVAHLGEDNLEAARICAELATACAIRGLAAAPALQVGRWGVAHEPDEDFEDRGSIDDVMSAEEQAEYDRDTEYRLDAEDDARNTAAYEAEQRDGV